MSITKILIADDDPFVREAIHKILEIFGYQVTSVSDGQQAIDVVDESFSTIILDINMPVMDGFLALEHLNKRGYEIPVLFLTGAGSMDYAVKAISLGAYDFLTKPINDLDLFAVKIKRAVEKRMYVLMSNAFEENLQVEVKKKTKDINKKNILLDNYSRQLEETTLDMITTLQVALEEKDQYTAGHTKRVTHYGQIIGKAMGLSKTDLLTLSRASQIHDIGKLVIDVSCIQKPGPLNAAEWALVRKHPEIGFNIVAPLTFLAKESQIIRYHHERIDGSGYPERKDGKKLDMITKILMVADSYDAMTSKRSYKINKSMDEAIKELRDCAGTQFDSQVVEVFIVELMAS
jgi:putative two-component system response regulator